MVDYSAKEDNLKQRKLDLIALNFNLGRNHYILIHMYIENPINTFFKKFSLSPNEMKD